MKTTCSLALLIVALLLIGPALSQPPKTPPAPLPKSLSPKLEPIAETKLLMIGLASPNFKGLEKQLRDPPKDDQAWVYARGQALLIAETGNLLMLRPPRNQGEPAWFERAMELRTRSAALAKVLSEKNYPASRAEFVNLANTCNRCHQAFRVPVQIEPFGENATP